MGKASASATTLSVKVVPRASRDEVVGWAGGVLRLRVSAPPQDGRANAAVIALLAAALGVRKSAVAISTGLASSLKRVAIEGLTRNEIERRLGTATGHENDAAI
jgi:uncharacterized protein (TIGR00251 family)